MPPGHTSSAWPSWMRPRLRLFTAKTDPTRNDSRRSRSARRRSTSMSKTLGPIGVGRKKPRVSPLERARFFDDEVRDLVDHGVHELARAADESALVGAQLELALALGAGEQIGELGVERHERGL